MAKRKTKKVEKPTKISNEHLSKMQDVINNLNRGQMEVGSLETRKQAILDHVKTFQVELARIQKDLKKEYGTDNINIHTGEINYDEQANQKITVGKDYKNDAMHYAVGQEVYGGHTISDILEEKDKYSIYIKKNKDVLPWKDFNKNMAISIEYNLQY